MRRNYKQIKSADLPELLQQGAAIIDVRRPEEWQLTGVVAGSELLTFFDEQGHSQPGKWMEQLDLLVTSNCPLVLI
ncbi:MAG: hypothetical protein U9Q61_06645 [Thermodesulfobacteriota bacterium]|nr:hypothetical protein [Thermodesulfobacteriota bacterium]